MKNEDQFDVLRKIKKEPDFRTEFATLNSDCEKVVLESFTLIFLLYLILFL